MGRYVARGRRRRRADRPTTAREESDAPAEERTTVGTESDADAAETADAADRSAPVESVQRRAGNRAVQGAAAVEVSRSVEETLQRQVSVPGLGPIGGGDRENQGGDGDGGGGDGDAVKQLRDALGGWLGADEERAMRIVRNASDAEKERILADEELVGKLQNSLGRERAMTALRTLDAPLPERLRTAMDGWGADGAAIASAVENASDAERRTVAEDAALVNRLHSELSQETFNPVADSLFAATSDLAAMERLFEYRFAAELGSGWSIQANFFVQSEESFGPNGLRRIYNLFTELPPGHVAQLDTLMAEKSSKSGAPGGTAVSPGPAILDILSKEMVKLRYGEGNTGAAIGGGYTDPGDRRRGMNAMDTTTAHELAHIVDRNDQYSGMQSFLDISGWEKLGGASTVVPKMEGDMPDPFGGADLTAQEEKIGRRTAELTIENGRTTLSDVKEDVQTAYSDLGFNTGGRDNYREAEALAKAIRSAPLVQHAARGHPDNSPWYTAEPTPYLEGHEYHQPYGRKPWMRYDKSARKDKLSEYQFRDPGEEFSELYAVYHCSEPPGSRVGDERKAWFEEQGLDEAPK